MRAVTMKITMLLVVMACLGNKPAMRHGPHAVLTDADVARWKQMSFGSQPYEETDFECMDEGDSGVSLCWTKEGVGICAEGINGEYVIVDTEHWSFGDRSLGSRKHTCISDTPAHLLLRFDPHVQWFETAIKRDTDGESRITCWFTAETVGDIPAGLTWEAPEGGNSVYTVGFWEDDGIVACAIHGVIDTVFAIEGPI